MRRVIMRMTMTREPMKVRRNAMKVSRARWRAGVGGMRVCWLRGRRWSRTRVSWKGMRKVESRKEKVGRRKFLGGRKRLLRGGAEPLLLQLVHEAAFVQSKQGAVDGKTERAFLLQADAIGLSLESRSDQPQ